jgi:hypothetical protein
MQTSKTIDLFVKQGDSVTIPIALSFDLSDLELDIQIKKYYNTSYLYPASVSVVGEPEEGEIMITIPASTSSTMDSERYVYQIIANLETTPNVLLTGQILVDRF